MSELVQQYEASLSLWLREDGFPNLPALVRHHDDHITMVLMAIPQKLIFQTVVQKFMSDITVKELIFGVDRFTKPGQGTKYADVLTIFWWQRERDDDHGFRFGVVNYRPPPHAIIEPIDWNNAFWNTIMAHIVSGDYRQIEAISDAGERKPH